MKMSKFLEKGTYELKDWLESLFIRNLPGTVGIHMRRLYYARQFGQCFFFSLSVGCKITAPGNIHLGDMVSIMHNCCLYAHDNGKIIIGKRVSINSNVILGAANDGEINIGNDVLIGPNVVIRASNHIYELKSIPINKQGHTGGKIIIEDDVWIGANVVILPNVSVGKGAVIGAGAVVNRDIPTYAMAGGVPAKVISECCRI
jgi:galactoside O-acetyltransferase